MTAPWFGTECHCMHGVKCHACHIAIHVLPQFPGEREHDESIRCWCGPTRDTEQPRVVIHERKAEA